MFVNSYCCCCSCCFGGVPVAVVVVVAHCYAVVPVAVVVAAHCYAVVAVVVYSNVRLSPEVCQQEVAFYCKLALFSLSLSFFSIFRCRGGFHYGCTDDDLDGAGTLESAVITVSAATLLAVLLAQ